MQCEIYWVDCTDPARIAVMPRPRGGDWLEDEMRSLRRDGVDVLVSLLMAAEEAELCLSHEAVHAASQGIQFLSFPFEDRGIPGDDLAADTLLEDLATFLQDGRAVAIHCRMGLGRAAMLAASLLVRRGWSSEAALAGVASARGHDVPDTTEQRLWVERYHKRISSRSVQ